MVLQFRFIFIGFCAGWILFFIHTQENHTIASSSKTNLDILRPDQSTKTLSRNVLLLDDQLTECELIQRSTLYSKSCNNTHGRWDEPVNKSHIPRRLLVTAVGSSGTTFLSNTLKKLGLHMSHDTYTRAAAKCLDGAVSWPHAFNDIICPHPGFTFRKHRRRRMNTKTQTRKYDGRYFLHVMHLVRHPLKTIEARWNDGQIGAFRKTGSCNTAQLVGLNHTESFRNATLAMALRHWVLWNTDLTVDVPPFSSEVMEKNVTEIDKILESVNKQANHDHKVHQDEPLSWGLLEEVDRNFAIMAQLMLKRYGYNDKDLTLTEGWEQICGFRQMNIKWNCRLVRSRVS